MNFDKFCSKADLLRKPELEKVSLLAFFHIRSERLEQFTPADAGEWFRKLNLNIPNLSRLRKNLKKSPNFVKATGSDAFKLHAREIARLDTVFPELQQKSEEITATDIILSKALYSGTRGFIESLSQQINASYEHNIFDGCAVLMRRLIEVLLILSYQHLGIDSQIQNSSGDYCSLSDIISNAKSNKSLGLTSTTRTCIDRFRKLGNFSAHKIHYNAKRADIDNVCLEFRAAVEELLYKAGIRS